MSFQRGNKGCYFSPYAINERPSISTIPITTNDCNQNNIDWHKWFAQTQPFEQNNSFNISLKKIIDDGYNIINYIIDYVSSLIATKQSSISSKLNDKVCNDKTVEIKRLKNELTKITAKLKKVNMRNEKLQKQIKEIKKELTKKNEKHKLYEKNNGLNKKKEEIVRLKADKNTLGSLLAIQCKENKKFAKMVNEYKEFEDVIIDLKEENKGMKQQIIDLEEKLRKKCNELRNIKGNNNYLIWNSDDIVDWMMLRENGRFRIYENRLRSNMKMEYISGKQLNKLSLNDVHRLGIKHFEDKKLMFGYIKELIKNNKNKRFDPEELCDPITFELMIDPVLVTVSGRTYDRKTIKSMIKKGDKEPFSGHRISNKHLISNKIVKELIVKYKQCKIIINE